MTRRKLEIFDELSISLDLVTERTAILATTGAGKTYLERVIAEELLELDQQVVILDPKGDFWGLRSSADGKDPGYEIVILGGEHADLELDYQAGAFLADLVVTERISAIFDLSDLTKAKQRVFVTDFSERLYYRKRKDRDPMLLIIDEADLFAPQNARQSARGGASKQEMDKLIGRMLDSMEDLVRRGRKRGIGTMLATQRSAVISKDVLDLTAVLIVMSTTGPRDLTAIEQWLEHHAPAPERKAIMDTIPSLPIGDAWIYSPRALKLLERAHVRKSRTFDSSETPRAGRALRKPKTVRDLDLPALSSTMEEMREKQAMEDPKLLQSRIRELEDRGDRLARQVLELEGREPETRVQTFEIPTIPPELIEAIDRMRVGIELAVGNMETDIAEIAEKSEESARQFREQAARGIPRDSAAGSGSSNGDSKAPKTVKPQVRAPISASSNESSNGDGARGIPRDGALSTNENKILGALLQIPDMDNRRLSIVTGMRGGTLNGALASLRKRGYLAERGLVLTEAGQEAAPRVHLPRGRELLEYWLDRLSRSEGAVLEYVYQHGGALTSQQISEVTGFRGGTLNGALAKLRAHALIVGSSGSIDCSEAFR